MELHNGKSGHGRAVPAARKQSLDGMAPENGFYTGPTRPQRSPTFKWDLEDYKKLSRLCWAASPSSVGGPPSLLIRHPFSPASLAASATSSCSRSFAPLHIVPIFLNTRSRVRLFAPAAVPKPQSVHAITGTYGVQRPRLAAGSSGA